ncbi:MAG: transcriptional regulator [Bacteroidetes bacterium]|nr:MAG: transcriptional regulator [Bacteroidota bacterium]
MTSIITGDIINSRKFKDQGLWMDALKLLFNEMGSQPKVWDIHRGDAFQLEVANPEKALWIALRIKSLVKSKAGVDARMAIGIGTKDFSAVHITESNGEAFVLSGTKYDVLKTEKTNLAIATPWADINQQLGLIVRLGLIAIDSWSRMSAEYVNLRLTHPDLNQLKVASQLGISQSSASARHKRSYYDEVMEMELYYRELISQKLKQ